MKISFEPRRISRLIVNVVTLRFRAISVGPSLLRMRIRVASHCSRGRRGCIEVFGDRRSLEVESMLYTAIGLKSTLLVTLVT